MTWWLFALLFFLAASTLAYQGRDSCDQWNRVAWCWTGLLLMEAWWLPNIWMGLLLAMVTLGCAPPLACMERAAIQNFPHMKDAVFLYPRHELLERIALPAGVFALAYTVMVELVQATSVLWILAALVGLGHLVGAWAWYSKYGSPLESYQRHLGLWFWVHDESRVCPRAGQGNANHAQAVAALAVASCYGLALAASPWWLFGLPLPLYAIALCHDERTCWLNQGVLHTLVATLVFLSLLAVPSVGAWGWACLILPMGAACWRLKPWQEHPHGGFDSGRLRLWREVLMGLWWPHGWRVRLGGFGTGSWRQSTPGFTIPRFQRVVFTAAHNEYVEQLFEHGLIGLVLLLGLLGTWLWQAWLGGPLGHALLIVELTLCSIALTNFPWTFFHTVQEPQPYAYAAMAPNVSGQQSGMAMQICKTQGDLQQIMRVMQQQGWNPTLTAWLHGQPAPMLLSPQDVLTLELDKTPKWVGSPALVALSFIVAVLAGSV